MSVTNFLNMRSHVKHSQQYKFAYISNYILNILLIIARLAIQSKHLELDKIIEYLDFGIFCLGIFMLLSLWNNAFIAGEDYRGKMILNSRTTKVLTFSLIIIEWIILYESASCNKDEFMIPVIICFSIWCFYFLGSILFNKNFIHKNNNRQTC